jgi:hypothetical protein
LNQSFTSNRFYIVLFVATIGLCVLPGSGRAGADTVLTADTSRPESSTFAIGETVNVVFDAEGLTPSQAETLTVNVVDEQDKPVVNWQTPVTADGNGNWHRTWAAPCSKLGFYRVWGKLSDGTQISGAGSRPSGYITYCIVPDPAKRVDVGEDNSRFGMQGGFSTKVNVLPYLGIRWVLGNYQWSKLEPDYPGQLLIKIQDAHAKHAIYPPKSAETELASYKGKPWHVYVVPSLYFPPAWATNSNDPSYPKGALTPDGKDAWVSFCSNVAKDFAANYPDEPHHYYQVTWEPGQKVNFPGSHSDLVDLYKLAYPAIHAADAKAVVMGPTGGSIWKSDLHWCQELADLGFGNYIDAVSIHPYFTIMTGPNISGSLLPETPGVNGVLVDNIHVLKNIFPGKPLIGTEQGFHNDPFGDSTGGRVNELLQARTMTRQNLIMLGEGFRLNMVFYITDIPGRWQSFGYYYNLLPKMPYGSTKISPKPVAPAYAAQSYLLEGFHSDGPLPNLAEGEYGYVFQRGNKVVLVLWTNSDGQNRIKLAVGADTVEIYDWMGNGSLIQAANKKVSVPISQEPIYITGSSASVWGK